MNDGETAERRIMIQKTPDREKSYQIGASSFTKTEWNRFLTEFDDIQETIRELMREKHAKREAERLEQDRLEEERLDRELDKELYDKEKLNDELRMHYNIMTGATVR